MFTLSSALTLMQVCTWLSLFFGVRENTIEGCRASCYGVLADLTRAAEEQPDEDILRKVQDSIKLM